MGRVTAPALMPLVNLLVVAAPPAISCITGLDRSTDQKLAEYAKQRGIRKSTLLRMIALDWLRDRERHAS